MRKPIIFLACLSLVGLFACEPKETPSPLELAQQQLEDFIKTQNEEASLAFSSSKTPSGLAVVAKHDKAASPVRLAEKQTSLLLGYVLEKEPGAGEANLLKAVLHRKDTLIYVLITDSNGETVERIPYPAADLRLKAPEPGGFEDIDDCLDAYFCTLEAVQCEANRTCEAQGFGVICCLNNNTCIAIDFFFPPTNPLCKFRIFQLDLPLVLAEL